MYVWGRDRPWQAVLYSTIIIVLFSLPSQYYDISRAIVELSIIIVYCWWICCLFILERENILCVCYSNGNVCIMSCGNLPVVLQLMTDLQEAHCDALGAVWKPLPWTALWWPASDGRKGEEWTQWQPPSQCVNDLWQVKMPLPAWARAVCGACYSDSDSPSPVSAHSTIAWQEVGGMSDPTGWRAQPGQWVAFNSLLVWCGRQPIQRN